MKQGEPVQGWVRSQRHLSEQDLGGEARAIWYETDKRDGEKKELWKGRLVAWGGNLNEKRRAKKRIGRRRQQNPQDLLGESWGALVRVH